MSTYLKIAVLAAACAVSALLLKRYSGTYGIVVSLAGCCAIGALVANLAEPVIDFAAELSDAANLDRTQVAPLLKAAGIGLLTQISAATCQDAGEQALAKLVETGGSLLCLGLSLPLLRSLLTLIRTMIGGSV